MTTLHFANFSEVTIALRDRVEAEFRGAGNLSISTGFSNQSCSAYLEIAVMDDDGEYIDYAEIKLRFSDHSDRHGSDVTFRIDNIIEVVEEDGEYVETIMSSEDFDSIVKDALAHAGEIIARARGH